MRKGIITFLTAAAFVSSASAGEAPLWLRNTAISPDGQTVAFTFMGDVYTVPLTGGNAKQITTSPAYDTAPVWSPDGKRIAFSSQRKGSSDIYVVDAIGGTPKRITTHSDKETPLAFKNDSILYISANIMPSVNATNGYVFSQVYSVNTNQTSSRPKLELSFTSNALSVDSQGRVLYEDKKGYEDRFRKHERSSGTSDIWLVTGLDTSAPSFKKLTAFNGHSLNPQWGNRDTFYYVSEEDGTLNVYEANLNSGSKRQLTSFKNHPVRSLSVARGGNMVFSQNGEMYTMSASNPTPRKINVEIIRDNTDDRYSVERRYGATDAVLSPSGKEVAFVARGDVYVTSVEYNTTKQITNTAAQERNLTFTPDGRSIIFDSERDGNWQIFKTSLVNPSEKSFVYATEFEETPLVSTDKTSFQPVISPDGNKLAYLEDRSTLKVLDLKSGVSKTVMDGKYAYSYTDGDLSMEWSPDSEWLLFNGYLGIGGWNNSDIAAVKADGSEIVNLTESGYSNGNGHWSKDGKAVLYETDKQGYRSHGSWGAQYDVFIMFLDGDAYDKFVRTKEEVDLAKEESKNDETSDEKESKDKKKKDKDKDKKEAVEKKPLVLDFANRKERVRRLTPRSSSMGDYFITPEMDKLYYVARFDQGADLRMIDLKKGEDVIVSKDWGYGALVPDSAAEKLFSLSNGIKIFNLGSKDVKNVDFKARTSFSPSEEREYIFEHMKQLVKNKFYDKNLHGVDWEKYTAEYSRFLPYINNDTDFAEMLSEILGELNASHTGARSYASNLTYLDDTAVLGAFFDESYDGDGLRIAEVIARGPLAIKGQNIKEGDIITAIEGQSIVADSDYFPLLAGKAGERVRLTVKHPDGKTENVVVKPISAGSQSNLLYKRWVDRNKAVVDSVSGGRIGYVHIKGMDSESFRTIYDEVLGKYRNCDAIVVDTRYNGGGWLHNDVALLFNGKKYVDYAPRGRYIGSDPFSQWTKPSAMLINECNYSDAHGTPYTYKTLGIGKLVGAPVPGTMTAVWWENQVNPNLIFGIPQVTSLDVNGNVLENQQLNPDVLIYNAPEEFLNGIDRQLIEATKMLMNNSEK